MNTLNENELGGVTGGGMPVANWPAPGYTPPPPTMPSPGGGDGAPRHVDN